MARAYEALNALNWSEIELNTYRREWKRTTDNQAAENYLIHQGIKKGIQQGMHNKEPEIARNMLKRGYQLARIRETTGLYEAGIDKLLEEMRS